MNKDISIPTNVDFNPLKLWFAKEGLDYTLYKWHCARYSRKYRLSVEDVMMEGLQYYFTHSKLKGKPLSNSLLAFDIRTIMTKKYGLQTKKLKNGVISVSPVSPQQYYENQSNTKLQWIIDTENNLNPIRTKDPYENQIKKYKGDDK